MDIYQYLKNDHKKVMSLFEKIFAAAAIEQESIFEEIMEELILHTKTEEETFYKALKDQSATKSKIAHSFDEHVKVEKILTELSALTARDSEWKAKLEELQENVQHHVKEEEEEIFPKAKEILSDDDAKALAKEMQKLKEEEEALPIE